MKKVLIIGVTSVWLLFLHITLAISGLEEHVSRFEYGPWMRPVPPVYIEILDFNDTWSTSFLPARITPEIPIDEKFDRIFSPVPETSTQRAVTLDDERVETDSKGQTIRQKGVHYLQRTLREYIEIKRAGGWPMIAQGPPLRAGAQGSRVEALRRHLKITGDLSFESWAPIDNFDQDLETAVQRFQYRHGLAPDGIVGANTHAAMNISVDDRINQLQINLERWRSIPHDFGSRYLMVNIPGFELRIVENDAVVRKMRVIVGKKRRQTPVMSDRITYLELNPYWNIPRKIFLKDILPRIQEDPEYLVRQGIKVFDGQQREAAELDPVYIDWGEVSYDRFPYRLRQDPSEINALGKVKFMFPNQKGVYIHDTPGKYLFDKQKRTFSAGCVRVQDPLALAEYLLTEQNWDRKKLATIIESGQRKIIVLKNAIPVHLVYYTAWVDEEGEVNFREDIYGKDRQFFSDNNQVSSIVTTINNNDSQSLRHAN